MFPDVLDLEEVDDVLHDLAVADLLGARAAPVDGAIQDATSHVHMASEHEVVENAHAREELDVLERPRDAELRDSVRCESGDVASFEGDPPSLRPVQSGDGIQERGLPSAIRADDGEDLAALDVDGDARERHDTAESQVQICGAELGAHPPGEHRRRRARVRTYRSSPSRSRTSPPRSRSRTGSRARKASICGRPGRASSVDPISRTP